MESEEGLIGCVFRMLPHTLVLEHVCPATRLLEKRRQMFEVQEALEAHKQEFNRKVGVHFRGIMRTMAHGRPRWICGDCFRGLRLIVHSI